MYTLFGFKNSGSAAIECALELTGVPYRIVQAASWEEGAGLEELGRVNPLRQIPTLQLPTGQALTESAAILMHLAFTHPEAALFPADPIERAFALRGLVYIAANCYSCISVIDYPERYTTMATEEAREAVRAGARARLHRHWEIFADLYPAPVFLNGERPGALDLLAAVVSKWSGTRAHLEFARPGFFALLQRIDAHPPVAAVFARHWG